jgi:uncharacterized membrane protein
MEFLLFLLALYLVFALLVMPIWALIKVRSHNDELANLRHTVRALEERVSGQQVLLRNATIVVPPKTEVPPPPAPTPALTPVSAPIQPAAAALAVSAPPPLPAPPPLAPPPPAPRPAPLPEPAVTRPVYAAPTPAPGWMDNIDWEQFMGAKLFAWLGGFALFLGVGFFVKYSFEHDLIPPEVRVALGFLLALGLIVGGLKINRAKYAVTAQTLVAAGVVSLYAVTFACNSVYHFAFFGPLPTFLLMVLITATAFVLAVRLKAQVVAVLGMLGGFLTPVLLSTGVDNPPGLFGYLALLDAGLVAVALSTGWRHLVPLSAGGTVVMMIGWAERFFTAEKGPVAMTVCLGFTVLYLAANEIARRRHAAAPEYSWTAAALPLVGFGFALFFLNYSALAARAPLFLGYVLLIDAALLTLAWRDHALARIHPIGGLISFALLALWTGQHLTDELLPWALGAYLLFAALHTLVPLLLERRQPESAPSWWSQPFPPLTLVLMLVPLLKLGTVSFLIWPAILLTDLLAIGLAVLSASLAGVAIVLVLTLLATAACVLNVPAETALAPSVLLVLGGFAVFFFVAGLWLVRRLGSRLSIGGLPGNPVFGDLRAQLPAFASLLPFLLLIVACARLAVPEPSMVFGLGLLLVVLTLGLARLLVVEWLPACALAGMAAVEFAWHTRHFQAAEPRGPLAWYVGFYAVFALYPFLFRRDFTRLTGPWAVAAASGLAHFWMTYSAIRAGWPNEFLGLVPALFALAPLASLVVILKTAAADQPARLNQLAWFGGAALFFITLVFPIQFERQWLTVSWALEGAALLWLFHRVPHPGLRAVGVVLLCTAFARLALNPAVFSYHARSDTPILNWYLYSYGLGVAALFAGARLLRPPRDTVFGVNAPPLLHALAVVLAFLLLNIEIADFFTAPGERTLTFAFSGNFARDMTYTIAWALFALGLLLAGILRQTRAARYAAIALLSVALLKLFFHDLAKLAQLYRIGALFAVAVIAILASFAYQRFLPGNEKFPPPPP